jgi:hypothetical protein
VTRRADPEAEWAVGLAIADRLAEEIRVGGFEDIPESVYKQAAGAPGLTDGAVRLALWSNKPGRSHAEVLALIDSAIERQQARLRPDAPLAGTGNEPQEARQQAAATMRPRSTRGHADGL